MMVADSDNQTTLRSALSATACGFLGPSSMTVDHIAAGSTPIHSDYADDPEFAELLRLFVSEIPPTLKELHRCFETELHDELARKAHQLKGAGGGYGFPELTEIAGLLEKAVKSQEPQAISDAFVQVTSYLGRIQV